MPLLNEKVTIIAINTNNKLYKIEDERPDPKPVSKYNGTYLIIINTTTSNMLVKVYVNLSTPAI